MNRFFVRSTPNIVVVHLLAALVACVRPTQVSEPRARALCADCPSENVRLGAELRVHATWSADCVGVSHLGHSDEAFERSYYNTSCGEKPFDAEVLCSTPCEVRELVRERSFKVFMIRPLQLGKFSYKVKATRRDIPVAEVLMSRTFKVKGPDEFRVECLSLEKRKRYTSGSLGKKLSTHPWEQEFLSCESTVLSRAFPYVLIRAIWKSKSCSRCKGDIVVGDTTINGKPVEAKIPVGLLRPIPGQPPARGFSLEDVFGQRQDGMLSPGEYTLDIQFQGESHRQTVRVGSPDDTLSVPDAEN